MRIFLIIMSMLISVSSYAKEIKEQEAKSIAVSAFAAKNMYKDSSSYLLDKNPSDEYRKLMIKVSSEVKDYLSSKDGANFSYDTCSSKCIKYDVGADTKKCQSVCSEFSRDFNTYQLAVASMLEMKKDNVTPDCSGAVSTTSRSSVKDTTSALTRGIKALGKAFKSTSENVGAGVGR